MIWLVAALVVALACTAFIAWYYAERAGLWRATADILAVELNRWGYGDFHYGDTPRDPDVLKALAYWSSARKVDSGVLREARSARGCSDG